MRMFSFCCLLILTRLCFAAREEAIPGEKNAEDEKKSKWHYEKGEEAGPEAWWERHDECAGRRQSPIAFWDDDVIINQSLPLLDFINYDRPLRGLTIVNNGHTVKISIPRESAPTLSGGNLSATYVLAQIHVHWGAINSMGSEHVIGNDHYPFEMHMVHIKEGFDLDSALLDPVGLAVLAVFFELSNEKDNALTPILDHIDEIAYKGHSKPIESLDLKSLLPHDTSNFFTYQGSLTTPPCSQVVVWTVFSEPHAIATEQLRSFRNVHVRTEEQLGEGEPDLADKMLFNHRPTQPTNRRPILARRHKVGLPKRCVVLQNSASDRHLLLLTLSSALLLSFIYSE